MGTAAPSAGRRWRWVVGLGLLPALASAGPLDPGSTLCLHPLVLPRTAKDTAAQRGSVETRLIEALVAASYRVPPPATVAALVARVHEEVGGTIDPATGRRDAERHRAYRARRAAALRDELGCDAQLAAQVVMLKARFFNGSAVWDGTTDQVSSTGRVVLNLLGGVSESGWVTALSLWLRAADLDGDEIAFRSAGIESLVSMAVLRDTDVLPEDVWLTDVEKLDAAIQSALGAGGDRLRTQGTPAAAARVQRAEEEARRVDRTIEQLRR